jgi:hypothetical protein
VNGFTGGTLLIINRPHEAAGHDCVIIFIIVVVEGEVVVVSWHCYFSLAAPGDMLHKLRDPPLFTWPFPCVTVADNRGDVAGAGAALTSVIHSAGNRRNIPTKNRTEMTSGMSQIHSRMRRL